MSSGPHTVQHSSHWTSYQLIYLKAFYSHPFNLSQWLTTTTPLTASTVTSHLSPPQTSPPSAQLSPLTLLLINKRRSSLASRRSRTAGHVAAAQPTPTPLSIAVTLPPDSAAPVRFSARRPRKVRLPALGSPAPQARNTPLRTRATSSATMGSRHLFVPDQHSKLCFLIDTGADVSVLSSHPSSRTHIHVSCAHAATAHRSRRTSKSP